MNPLIKDRPSPLRPAGDDDGAWLALLEPGAHLLQDSAPLRGLHVYVVGFHCAKGEPDFQMEAHHYCKVVNDELLQCVLFDGNTKAANLIGIEYIVSERLFGTLPEAERPKLMWSFNRDGECDEALKQDRDTHHPGPGGGRRAQREAAAAVSPS